MKKSAGPVGLILMDAMQFQEWYQTSLLFISENGIQVC